jgi:selenide, water dikinase
MDFELTKYVRKAGCASKIGPGDLTDILCGLEIPGDENVLVGIEGFEDAGVYKLTNDIALVQTIDFFTPVVNDPHSFGRIAAANALSDIYAMGAEPKTALNIVCFSVNNFDKSILKEILRGGAEKLAEAGVSLLGGHSVDDMEIKYGLAVTGTIHPDKIILNEGAMAGDILILTKPLGNGIINTGIKSNMVSETCIERVVETMAALNNKASHAMLSVRTHAATDVTGFGLVGHLKEMIKDNLGVELFLDKIPYFEEAAELSASGIFPGGLKKNRDFYKIHVVGKCKDFMDDIIYDPQTSGGLLIAIHPDDIVAFEKKAGALGLDFWIIGKFLDESKGKIILGKSS